MTKEHLLNFLNDFLQKTIKPHHKSQEAPTSNRGPVKIIVGKTFN